MSLKVTNTSETSVWHWTFLFTCFCFPDHVSPGGRGINGNPIIVLPEFPAFDELQEEEVQNVFGYLTSIPGLASHTDTQHTHTNTPSPPSLQFVWQQTKLGRVSQWTCNTAGSQQMSAQYKRPTTGSERNLGRQEIIEGMRRRKRKIATKGMVRIN